MKQSRGSLLAVLVDRECQISSFLFKQRGSFASWTPIVTISIQTRPENACGKGLQQCIVYQT